MKGKKHANIHNGIRVRSIIFLLALISFLFSGCGTLDQLVKKPVVSFAGLNMVDATLLDGTLLFNFNVENPNAFPIRASGIVYKLKLNGHDFVSGNLDKGISLPARTTGALQVPVAIRYLEAFDSLADMTRRGSAAYDLAGSVRFGPLSVPYRTKGTIDLPKMPKLHLDAINVSRLSLFGATLRCRLGIENPNNFNLLFKKLNYDLKLGGISFAQASAKPAAPIIAKANTTMDFSFDVSFTQLGHSAYQLLTGNKTDYHMEGRILMDTRYGGERMIPFNFGGKVPFSK